jgi:hypothetical protein
VTKLGNHEAVGFLMNGLKRLMQESNVHAYRAENSFCDLVNNSHTQKRILMVCIKMKLYIQIHNLDFLFTRFYKNF